MLLASADIRGCPRRPKGDYISGPAPDDALVTACQSTNQMAQQRIDREGFKDNVQERAL